MRDKRERLAVSLVIFSLLAVLVQGPLAFILIYEGSTMENHPEATDGDYPHQTENVSGL